MAEPTVTTVKGSESADVSVSLADQATAAAAAAAATAPSAESLGVSPEQFAKFYNTDTGYNWQGHSKELEFRAAQSGAASDATLPADEADAQSIAADAGLDWDALEVQVVENGDLDQASYDALKAIGIPDTFVKDYINTVSTQAAAHVETVMSAFGGEANLDKVKEYSQANYTKAEMDEIDLKLSDPATYKLTVDQLIASAGVVRTAAGALITAPNALGGESPVVKGFENEAQMVTAMRDPRYKTDPAFRQEVTSKVAAASFASNPRAHTGGL